MGASTRVNPRPSKKSRTALMIVWRTRTMACWRFERSHRCRLSMRKSVPCSLGPMGYSCDVAASSRIPVASSSYCPSILPCFLTVPTTSTDDSCAMWSASAKVSGETLPLNTTHWTIPVPSRTSRKCSLPLDRRWYSHPRSVTVSPTWLGRCSMRTSLMTGEIAQSPLGQARAATLLCRRLRGAVVVGLQQERGHGRGLSLVVHRDEDDPRLDRGPLLAGDRILSRDAHVDLHRRAERRDD